MKPGKSMLYDNFRDRRNAVFFVFVPLALLGAGVLVAALLTGLVTTMDATGLLPYAVGGFVLWFVWVVVRLAQIIVRLFRAPGRRGEKWERKELSSDELRVARSKLVRKTNRNGA